MDEKTALILQERGFVFTKETVAKGAVLYAFAKTPEIELELTKNFSDIGVLEESTLRFGRWQCQKV